MYNLDYLLDYLVLFSRLNTHLLPLLVASEVFECFHSCRLFLTVLFWCTPVALYISFLVSLSRVP